MTVIEAPVEFTRATPFIDSDHPTIARFARDRTKSSQREIERALALYKAVRDDVSYELYLDYRSETTYRASGVLESGKGFCVGKAALLAACARAVKIPARVGYADVKNHLTSPRLRALMGTDLFVWHSYAELWLNNKWVKATPSFDINLCERVGVSPLDFDGRNDSLFQAYDKGGKRHMEYVHERGTYSDVPADIISRAMCDSYPGLIGAVEERRSFEQEVVPNQPQSSN
jgi:transglutaminase-like putative cysteine protease